MASWPPLPSRERVGKALRYTMVTSMTRFGEFERAWERFMIVEREALPRFSCTQPQPEIY
jgi:hypothetical protein